MTRYVYSGWDGRQNFPDIAHDRLLTELERTLTAAGDIPDAIWKIQREGIVDGDGKHLPGNRELFQRLEEKRRELLEKYDFTPVTKALRRQMEKISDAEKLTEVPEDISQQLESLKHHRFINPDAQQEFERLMEALSTNSLEPLGGAGNAPKGYPPATALAEFNGSVAALSVNEVIDFLSLLQKIDRLKSQLKANQRHHSLEAIEPQLVAELLGDESAGAIDYLHHLTDILTDAGYIRETNGTYDLTPRAMRKIGQRALQEIYSPLYRDVAGRHHGSGSPVSGIHLEETKKYESGDDFNIHLMNTVMNSLRRAPRKPPLNLTPDDLETVMTEPLIRCATVLMVDLSRSMPRHGNFQAAKRTALALTELIRTRFPTDDLNVIGFSTSARIIAPGNLAQLEWDKHDRYTNIQHGLWLARHLLARDSNANKHIIIVTDGEPTAHMENGHIFCKYPPAASTRQATLAEVRNCTEVGIAISAFVFDGAEFTKEFLGGLARINRSRIFYSSASNLGRFILVDYIRHHSKLIN